MPARAEKPPILLLEWDNDSAIAAGFASDASGNVYIVSQYVNPIIRKYDEFGNLLMSFGPEGTGDGELMFPNGIELDASGDVYVVDAGNDRVQMFDAGGSYVLKWGQSGTGPGEFTDAVDVAIDSFGNVYVTDRSLDRVQKFDATGNYALEWGSNGTAPGMFDFAAGIAINSYDEVYVVDIGNGRVQVFNTSGQYLREWGPEVPLNLGGGIDVDENDDVYVSGALPPPQMYKFSRMGGLLTQWGHPLLTIALTTTPGGLVFLGNPTIQKWGPQPPILQPPPDYLGEWFSPDLGDLRGGDTGPTGDVYVADEFYDVVHWFDEDGNHLGTWGGTGSANGQFIDPNDVAVSQVTGDVYVLDHINSRVQRFDANGEFLSAWGSAGSGDGQFQGAWGIAVGPSGNVYVSDASTDRIQKFNANGTFLLAWGSSGADPGQLDGPYGLAVDASEDVYVADGLNGRIQKFDSDGAFLLATGSGGVANGQLDTPSDVEVDTDGNIFVVDAGNGRLQKFASNGTFLTNWSNDLVGPWGVAIGPGGDIYVTDGSRIRKFGATAPTIMSIGDVENDQGLQARITLARSGRDFAHSVTPVVQYEAFRRVDDVATTLLPDGTPLPRPVSPAPPVGRQLSQDALRAIGWEFAGAAPASGQDEYNMIVPTLADSSSGGIHWSSFFVRAATATPIVFFDSDVDSGYSVDNLVPPVPAAPLVVEIPVGGHADLTWDPSPAADFFYFGVYRGTTPGFVPASPQDFHAVTLEPAFVDTQVAAGETWYYRVAAFDDSDGFSGYSDASGILILTGVREEVDAFGFELRQNAPNPFDKRTSIAFSLDVRSDVSLRIYDARGALVRRLAAGAHDAGPHDAVWDGRDERGRRVASGMYLYELRTPRERVVRKLVLAR
jgi:DNA-binding beta-propeller fold protein YncE